MPATASHAFKAATGQATLPRRMAIVCPVSRMMTLKPSSLSSRLEPPAQSGGRRAGEADEQQGAVVGPFTASVMDFGTGGTPGQLDTRDRWDQQRS